MIPLFAFFGPLAITVVLCAAGPFPYWWWVTRRTPAPPARWAAIGIAAAVAAYGAGTLYGLAFTNPLDLCATRTGDGRYEDAGRDYSLVSVHRDGFPPSVVCHWSSGHSTDVVWFWVTPLLYAGLAVAVTGFVLLLLGRRSHRRAGRPGRRAP
ncbi:hypothetical protein [Streptomyces sp. NPDC093970]|uniref:hypothetical protein n=1 Tax=Streptomyces sp. NPDC093970 TaxID=3155076 RepID=UPI00342BFF50